MVMIRILLTLALLLWATTAQAQWSLVQTRTACPSGCDVTDDWTSTGVISVTGLTTTTAGNTLVIYAQAGNDSRTVSSVSCNGDTATALHTEYGTRMAYLGAVVVATTGTSCTVTLNGASTSSNGSVVVQEWSGGAATLTEAGTSTGAINVSSVTAHTAATVTPSNAPVLYVSVLALSAASGGMTHDADFTGAAIGGTVMYYAYRTQTDTTAQGITYTSVTTRGSNVALAALEGAAAGGGCTGGLLLLGAGKCDE